jgi:hypothetical protein
MDARSNEVMEDGVQVQRIAIVFCHHRIRVGGTNAVGLCIAAQSGGEHATIRDNIINL